MAVAASHTAAAAATAAKNASAQPPPPPPPPQQQQQQQQQPQRPQPFASRERVTIDGRLVTGAAPDQQQQQQPVQQLQRPPGLPAAAPAALPVSQAELERLVEELQRARSVCVLTGAGVSTESNLPDYRGPQGAYSTGFKPMTQQQFTRSAKSRARYWARSFAGWEEFATVQPSAAHEAIARLQRRGWLGQVVTQNVDRLHHKAGSPPEALLELHGTTHEVVCLSCGALSCRHELQRRMAEANPELAARVRAMSRDSGGIATRGAWARALSAGTAADARKVAGGEGAERIPVRRPDGDVELVDAGVGFNVAPCEACGERLLQPNVTFFGASVPQARKDAALAAAEAADALLCVGTSLFVYSAFRLVTAAKAAGARVLLVNVGETRADGLADLKVAALAGEVMSRLAAHPSLLLPRA